MVFYRVFFIYLVERFLKKSSFIKYWLLLYMKTNQILHFTPFPVMIPFSFNEDYKF